MREVNRIYTQAFNRRYSRVGHVLQGRYKAIVVDQDAYQKELSRYIVLNPVRARLVERAEDSTWSSYRAVMGKTRAPDWFAFDQTLVLFHSKRGPARRAYARFVHDGVGMADPHNDMQRAGILGCESFVERVMECVDPQSISSEVVRGDRPTLSLGAIARRQPNRDAAIRQAYATGAYTLTEIARYFGLHRSTASRIARAGN